MNNYYWNVKCEKCVEEDWDDEDTEYGENPAWNW